MAGEGSSIRLVERSRIHRSSACVYRLLFSPDGSLLVWNGETKEIHVSRVTDGEILYSVTGTHLDTCMAFSVDGRTLLSDGASSDVFVHDAGTGEARKSLAGHTANLTSIVVSPASSVMASSDAVGMVKLWDFASGEARSTTSLSSPYLGMNIGGAAGLTIGQRRALLSLGAVDE